MNITVQVSDLKCPYCGDVDSQYYDILNDSGYDDDIHWVEWEAICLACNEVYLVSEQYKRVWNSVRKDH